MGDDPNQSRTASGPSASGRADGRSSPRRCGFDACLTVTVSVWPPEWLNSGARDGRDSSRNQAATAKLCNSRPLISRLTYAAANPLKPLGTVRVAESLLIFVTSCE